MSGKKSTVRRGRQIVFEFSSWACGLFIGLMGVVSTGDSVVGGLILLLAGVLLLPPVFTLVRRQVPALKGWSNALVAGIMFVTGIGFLPASTPEPEVRGVRDQLIVEEEESADTAIQEQLQAAEEALEIEAKAREEAERVAPEEKARAEEEETLRKRQAEEAEQARLAQEQRVREEEARIAREQEAAARAEEERAAREAEATRQAEAQRQAEAEQARREEAARARPVAPAPVSGGVIKRSVNMICHAPGSTYYSRTKNFTPFDTMDACLASGARLPKR